MSETSKIVLNALSALEGELGSAQPRGVITREKLRRRAEEMAGGEIRETVFREALQRLSLIGAIGAWDGGVRAESEWFTLPRGRSLADPLVVAAAISD